MKGTDPTKIDHRYTDQLICPWCGHAQSDEWEYFIHNDTTEVNCDACEKPFMATQERSVSYTTEKKEEPRAVEELEEDPDL